MTYLRCCRAEDTKRWGWLSTAPAARVSSPPGCPTWLIVLRGRAKNEFGGEGVYNQRGGHHAGAAGRRGQGIRDGEAPPRRARRRHDGRARRRVREHRRAVG